MNEIPHMPHVERSPQLEDLIRRLKSAHVLAGGPAYRKIAKVSGGRLSTSTISRMFRAANPPKWENLVELLLALNVGDKDIETSWYPMWVRARAVKNHGETELETEKILPPGRAPAGLGACGRCGAWVSDPVLHSQFHQRLMRAEETIATMGMLLSPIRTPEPPAPRRSRR